MRAWARAFATRGQVSRLSSRVGKLEYDVRRLEAELQETRRADRRVAEMIDDVEMQDLRRLNRRLAEIIDVVQEVLVPAANRDDERLRRLLDEYSKRL